MFQSGFTCPCRQEARIKREEAEIKGKVVVSVPETELSCLKALLSQRRLQMPQKEGRLG